MKVVLRILFFLFIVGLVAGIYLKNTNHEKGDVVLGLSVLFLSFILMPLFIFNRYKQGKYKKYILDGTKKNPFKIDNKEE